jgi:hypothetical protein
VLQENAAAKAAVSASCSRVECSILTNAADAIFVLFSHESADFLPCGRAFREDAARFHDSPLPAAVALPFITRVVRSKRVAKNHTG